MDWIIAHWQEVVAVAGAIVIVARLIVKLTPTQADDAWLAKVLDVIGHIGLSMPDKTQGNGKTPTVLLLLLLPLLAGCAAETRYVLDATAEGAKSVGAIEIGIQESRGGLATRLAQEEGAIFGAYQEDLAKLIGEVALKTKTPEEAAAKLATLAGKYQKALSVAQVDRSRAAERYNRMLEHTALLRGILAQVYNLEQGRATADQKLQDFKVLAANYAAEKFGLTPTVVPAIPAPPAPAVDAGPVVPATTSEGGK